MSVLSVSRKVFVNLSGENHSYTREQSNMSKPSLGLLMRVYTFFIGLLDVPYCDTLFRDRVSSFGADFDNGFVGVEIYLPVMVVRGVGTNRDHGTAFGECQNFNVWCR